MHDPGWGGLKIIAGQLAGQYNVSKMAARGGGLNLSLHTFIIAIRLNYKQKQRQQASQGIIWFGSTRISLQKLAIFESTLTWSIRGSDGLI